MNLRQRILVAALVFSCLIGHTIYGTGSDDVSIDEDVSQCFEELSISNGTSLVVKTSLYEDFLFSKVSMKRCRRVHPGKVFVLGLGETLHFHAPDVWEDLRLTFFQPSDTERGGASFGIQTGIKAASVELGGVQLFHLAESSKGLFDK